MILANLPEDASSNFDFTLCNTVIVEKCLQEIRMNKSSGYDGIIPRLLKDSASIISGPHVPFSIHQSLQVIIQTTGRRVKLHRFLKKTTSFLKQTTDLSLYYSNKQCV